MHTKIYTLYEIKPKEVHKQGIIYRKSITKTFITQNNPGYLSHG